MTARELAEKLYPKLHGHLVTELLEKEDVDLISEALERYGRNQWNAAVEAAALRCERDATALREQLPPGTIGQRAADACTSCATNIRALKRDITTECMGDLHVIAGGAGVCLCGTLDLRNLHRDE